MVRPAICMQGRERLIVTHQGSENASSLSIDQNKALIRSFFKIYSDRDPSRFEALLTPGYRDHGHDPAGVGIKGARDDYDALTATFDDIGYDVQDMVAEGDRVAVRWSAAMTHIGEFMGVAATNRRVQLRGFSIYKIENGRVAATWNLQDVAALREQITGEKAAAR